MSNVIPNSTPSRDETPRGVHQPQVWGQARGPHVTQIPVSPKPQTSVQLGERWTSDGTHLIQGRAQLQGHLLWRRWHCWMGAGDHGYVPDIFLNISNLQLS